MFNNMKLKILEQALQTHKIPPAEALYEFGGLYAYKCQVKSESSFLNGDWSRAGLVFLIPMINADGLIVIIIFGLRLASTTKKSRNQQFILHNQQFLLSPAPWTGEGSLSYQNVKRFTFQWQNHGNEQGKTDETILVSPVSMIWPGKFEHTRRDGVSVTGEVKYQRVEATTAVPWLPNIRPLDYLEQFWGMILNGNSEVTLPKDIRLQDYLQPELVAVEGKRLYDNLPQEDKATVAEPYVLIDIFSRTHTRVNRENRIQVAKNIKEKHPNAVLYRAEADNEPEIRFGMGPINEYSGNIQQRTSTDNKSLGREFPR